MRQLMDDGIVQAFRLPNSKDRRVPFDALRDFMVQNDIPTNRLDGTMFFRLVWFTATPRDSDVLRGEIVEWLNAQVEVATNLYQLGKMVQRLDPQVVVIEMTVGESAMRTVMDKPEEGRYYIALQPEDEPVNVNGLKFEKTLRRPIDADELLTTLMKLKRRTTR